MVLGYKIYVEQALPFLDGQRIEASGMMHEIERAEQAIDLALAGQRVALVSGGDPGVYAMAGVVFEVAQDRKLPLGEQDGQLSVEVIPGIPALAAAAALLGAPLTHDFACVSLSDRLTLWEVITKRLRLAAEADFVIVLYNPKSKGRDWHFGEAIRLVSEFRESDTPVGVVNRAGREGQTVSLTTIGNALQADVDMQTTVVIGSSRSFVYEGKMVTPRGYLDKYSNRKE